MASFLPTIRLLPVALFFAFEISLAGHFSWSGDRPWLVDSVWLEEKRAKILELIGYTGPDILPKIEIVVARDPASFQRLAGAHFPDWGIAAVDRQTNRVLVHPKALHSGFVSFNETLVHEITHLLLNQCDQGAFLPRWFHEGLAMTFAGEISFAEQMEISKAIFANNLLTLSQIEGVNSFKSGRANLAYAQSHLAVSFLMRRFGSDVAAELMRASRKKQDFNAGLYEVLSIRRPELEKMVREELRNRYAWLFVLNDTWLFWLLGTVVFAAIVVIKKIQNRRTLRRWEKEDQDKEPPQKNTKGDNGFSLDFLDEE